MLLRSQISEKLISKGADLIVVSGNHDEHYFQKEFSRPQITLEPMPFRKNMAETIMRRFRQQFLMNPAMGMTQNFKNEQVRLSSPTRYWLGKAGNRVLGRFRYAKNTYMNLEKRLFNGDEFDNLLREHKPDLVVTGTPGYNSVDTHLLRAAVRFGITTATVMLSWDNLTSKGYMGANPDRLLVWSDLMADEAAYYHDYPKQRTIWTGAAQFDHYHGINERIDREVWRKSHGIHPDAALIMYGTINPAILPHEIEILRTIVAAMNAGRFKCRPHLWIRLHPQVIRGQYSRSLGPFRSLAGENVTVEEPPVQSGKLAWDLPKTDNDHLAGLLAVSDVVVTPCSTLVIDAACAGTPTINVFFDGNNPVSSQWSAIRFKKYTHYEKILKTGGIAIAETVDQFIHLVDAYIENPGKDNIGREAIIQQQLERLDGLAGERTAHTLIRLCKKPACFSEKDGFR